MKSFSLTDIRRENDRLRAENERLVEQVAGYRAMLDGDAPLPPDWRLTKTETALLRVLASGRLYSVRLIMDALYWRRTNEVPYDDIVGVYVCRIRKKLRPLGIDIITVSGQGYYLPAASLQRVRDALGGGAP
ncbi:winged helix-turn-helix domain-containing protein [Ancylobacter lacus]|uniref:winged helix-turn-helix domain-containing protein n=1 Tax=Ancylobacter lacus TaxID=2579970 RepID=UPI001BCE8F0D|nr:winged helix-turn-helix domain-containing protein [Ancylobacter lacus]MBS7539746.1 winged helix-turn-helix transcriptional regulator [Ancylobacter lacus]